ncbi:DUF308 domain-containing protein [Mesorhizobium sp. M1C.F.Ca.ET.193.01.1.1]|uniref:DUF308 domain-containing protein n=1 Tax=unclassified Mesorhizobium TaxID=325217 RepID=UPI000FD2E109|nr:MULTISPECIES: DUF308 domain-containing protein [unclassified Mesorhizobium]TGS93794.1 DUF308 domain-containing protein [bacterium M00.F.Ca.ET.177.01.1.1]TGQ50854.1 DUF308 domain-containing protein [Mesorhizobium sp. M1C.F.Ca.ET.210.01.1.1]TGQ66297.1 DUF308 domain-containing protein [Mesorhizobium sp. M1C.F.Ca.ET.212.01.1.1]TGR00321.1 DUF308 domain-containing protein [Mesorhizobium sp. M1C.F.Ca.ET.204.01.1.1]TGR20980.1 DUF308 domain-containing protein [Mesorhizobium sp. M1C.F.Ca.ET.196.01.1.
MSGQMNNHSRAPSSTAWLKSYYYLRFAVSAAWVAVAFTVAKNDPPLAAVMLVAYPVWDALANYVDARRTGGLSRNRSQLLNVVVSIVTAIAVAIALGRSMNAVLSVYGVWAVASGAFQLLTALRRWKTNGAQWAMILSGAQSALAGLFFVKMAGGTEAIGIANVAPYAAFGAFYFLVSAVWLSVSGIVRKSPQGVS